MIWRCPTFLFFSFFSTGLRHGVGHEEADQGRGGDRVCDGLGHVGSVEIKLANLSQSKGDE